MSQNNKNCELIVRQCLIELLYTHEPYENEVIDYTINTLVNYLIHICKEKPDAIMKYAETACKKLGKDVKLHLLSEDEFNDAIDTIQNKPKLLN